jgi:hypothetical protein
MPAPSVHTRHIKGYLQWLPWRETRDADEPFASGSRSRIRERLTIEADNSTSFARSGFATEKLRGRIKKAKLSSPLTVELAAWFGELHAHLAELAAEMGIPLVRAVPAETVATVRPPMSKGLIGHLGRGSKWTLLAGAGAVVGAIALALLGLATGQLQRLWRGPTPPLRLSVAREEEGFILQIPSRGKAAVHLAHAHGCDGLEAEARDAGGADMSATLLRLLIEGRSSGTVTITSMRALIISRGWPRAGALAFCQGGGEVSPIRLTFDLDSAKPIALRMNGNADRARPVGPYFGSSHLVTVAQHEVVPFELSGITDNHFVVWKIEVTADVDGGTHTFVVDDHGRPFRTAALRNARQYHPVYDWRWDLHPQRLMVSQHPDPNYYLFLSP